ncbi:hypothetical protein TREMEDRAFT_43268 [Tremella mesenterica DSM 1558]|uniref:uncharacterized protein n=1 Tax=Tremella mesenterica (strain ATCC 24925 / CBS 8224 / DSM 1558 / NBRC 9311 / NRRL Y-6157 / RJB 2259-6 / UBC 559-6) TaxID=578456 RepID=UPI0003F49947|nr:uncharacterized protein TREMEDRAFT_43268 [Tremella mesenterica DSM 1558]EIW70590.1 hypothetical protein TREMEDRAFT_43268 [Tremella mesenterica DSM 1558]
MSKLSPSLKALISAPHALGRPLPAPPQLTRVFDTLRSRSRPHLEDGTIPSEPFLVLATATLVTVNSPESVQRLWKYAVEGRDVMGSARTAALMREAGLKCIALNGIPRTINALVALRSILPEEVIDLLSSIPTRKHTPENIQSISSRGREMWDIIYSPFHNKLLDKLSDAHPDLPVHILESHYGPLLSDPSPTNRQSSILSTGTIGRTLTSIMAMSCLRAQTGVEPQLISHVHGLQKAAKEEDSQLDEKIGKEGRSWLCGDDGTKWVLESVDEISSYVKGGEKSLVEI